MALLHPQRTILLVANVLDPNGVNSKDRHVVLLNDLDSAYASFDGVAVTGTFSHPLPPSSILLRWQRQGAVQTGLTKPSVAVCTWIVTATIADIIRRRGMTSTAEMADILQQVLGNQPPPATATGS